MLSAYNDCDLQLLSLANDSADILDLSEEEVESAVMEVDDVAATYDCVECKLLNVQPVAQIILSYWYFVLKIYFLLVEVSSNLFLTVV